MTRHPLLTAVRQARAVALAVPLACILASVAPGATLQPEPLSPSVSVAPTAPVPAAGPAQPAPALSPAPTPPSRPVATVSRDAASLPGVVYVGMDLAGTSWNHADLRGASLTAVDLSRASLSGASLRGATLVRCSLEGADLTGADLSGATLSLVALGRANLAGARLDGARFDGVSFGLCGDRYTDALRQALAAGDGASAGLGDEWIAALTGAAFGFVYNMERPAELVGTPLTGNPLLKAFSALGYESKLVMSQSGADAVKALEAALGGGGVALMPLSMAGRGPTGPSFEEPFWGMALALEGTGASRSVRLAVPPFGEIRLSLAELDQRWTGPWATLQPAGATDAFAPYPLIVARSPAGLPEPGQSAVSALIFASEVANEPRTYGPLVPAAAGLRAAARDLQRIADSWETSRARALAQWVGGPLHAYMTARELAGAFCLQAAAAPLSAHTQAQLRQLSAIYSGIAQVLRTDLPALNPGSDTAPLAYSRAAQVVRDVADREQAAAAALRAVVEGGE